MAVSLTFPIRDIIGKECYRWKSVLAWPNANASRGIGSSQAGGTENGQEIRFPRSDRLRLVGGPATGHRANVESEPNTGREADPAIQDARCDESDGSVYI